VPFRWKRLPPIVAGHRVEAPPRGNSGLMGVYGDFHNDVLGDYQVYGGRGRGGVVITTERGKIVVTPRTATDSSRIEREVETHDERRSRAPIRPGRQKLGESLMAALVDLALQCPRAGIRPNQGPMLDRREVMRSVLTVRPPWFHCGSDIPSAIGRQGVILASPAMAILGPAQSFSILARWGFSRGCGGRSGSSPGLCQPR
jgi:hypothetical protein